MNLSQVIFFRLVFTSAFVVFAMAAITVALLSSYIPQWTSDTGDYMEREEYAALLRRTTARSEAISEQFKSITNDVGLVIDYARGLLDGTLAARTNYASYSVLTTAPSGVSFWWNNFNTNANRDITSLLDDPFRAVQSTSSKYLAVYYGEPTGFFRQYPHQQLPSYQNNPAGSYCHKNGQTVTYYDPSCRQWFTGAQNLAHRTVNFTSPYNDAASGNVLITASGAVRNAANVLLGVVGLDIQMVSIQRVVNAKIQKTGFFALVTADGTVVSTPGLQLNRPYSYQEIAGLDAGSAAQVTGALASASLSGTLQLKSKGKDAVASFSKVSGTDYSIIGIIPKEEVTEETDDIESTGNSRVIAVIVILVINIVVMIVVSSIFVSTVARRNTAPINQMQVAAENVANGDLSTDLTQIPVLAKELVELRDAFYTMQLCVGTTNEQFVMSHPARAQRDFEYLLTHLDDDHNWSRGSVLNNVAVASMINAQKQRTHPEQNDVDRETWIILAESIRLAETCDDDTIDASFKKRRVADRKRKLGEYLLASNPDLGAQLLNDSLTGSREIENFVGVTHAVGKLAMVNDGALTELDAMQKGEANKGDSEIVTLASLYLAEANMKRLNYMLAIEHLRYGLAYSATISPNFRLRALILLQKCFIGIDQKHRANEVKAKLKELGGATGSSEKIISFVLDCSYSMNCKTDGLSFIEASRNAINTIVDSEELVDESTHLGLIKFGNQSYRVVDPVRIEDASKRQFFRDKVLYDTDLCGATAFYNALSEAVQTIQTRKGNMQKIIVALTDGEDNRSSKTPNDIARELQGTGIMCFIITVGNVSTAGELRMIAESSDGGKLLAAADATKIGESFQAAMSSAMAMDALES